MKILHVGATGLVGMQVLQQLLEHPQVRQVVAPTRRPLPSAHAKLLNPLVDFERLPVDADWWAVDAAICTLGTTMKQAGSRAAFRRVDHDYPLQVARCVREHGARAFALNSAMGADAASRFFYNRVKGELEEELQRLHFASLTLVRPGLIGGQRAAPRAGEALASRLLTTLHPLLPRRLRINPAQCIARALVQAAVQAAPGRHVVASDRLTGD